MPPRTLHAVVVPHTHWDREWYRTHEQFRVRLVALVDGLLDLLERDSGFRHFMLDGQTIVVDDYLEVRPHARARIEKLVRAGRLAVGPWHVLPDEWLVSGEALIRNLRLGLAKADALGGAMRVGYVPDQFGHVGQLPQILAGFGLSAAVLWRGVGSDVDRTLFEWEAPDGTRLPAVYLVHGYGNGVNLPTEPAALVARLRGETDSLAKQSDVSTLLLMNGSDHERPVPGLPRALEAARPSLDGLDVEIGSLADFVARALAERPATLPRHRGELRSGLRAPLLPGCASARMSQKQREFSNDRLLTRYLEPLAAWLGALGGDADPETIGFAWRVALENHPHDSVCGCSIDAVHAQMETRFDRVAEIAGAQLDRVTAALARRVAVPRAGFGRSAGAPLLVWNPNASGRARVDAEFEVPVAVTRRGLPRPFHLRRADGTQIPVAVDVLRAAGSQHSGVFERRGVLALLPGLRQEFDGLYATGIDVERRGDRVHARVRLGDAPDPNFDLEGERRALQALLADESIRDVAVETWQPPRVRLRFTDDLPGHGLRVYRLAPGAAAGAGDLVAEPLAGGGGAIENAAWRVEVDAQGSVTLRDKHRGLRIEDALSLVSEGDRGDEYNFDPVPGGACASRLERVRVRAIRQGGAEAAVRIDAVLRVPSALAASRDARAARTVALPVRVELRLAAGLDRIDVALEVDNRARDHRLRLHVAAPFRAERFEVESAFEVASRPIAPAPDAFGSARPAEFPVGAVPQRSFATLAGEGLAVTVANRGTAEVEAIPGANGRGALALTVLRAVGWLSRGDLRLRPGPAGPGLATPGAQAQGPLRAEFSIRLHSDRDPRRIAEAHGFAAPPLAFAGAEGDGAPLADGARLVSVDDPEVVVSAIEPLADGDAELRLLNASDAPRSVRIAWIPGVGPAGSLRAVDLGGRETLQAQGATGSSGAIALGPWAIRNLRVRSAAG